MASYYGKKCSGNTAHKPAYTAFNLFWPMAGCLRYGRQHNKLLQILTACGGCISCAYNFVDT